MVRFHGTEDKPTSIDPVPWGVEQDGRRIIRRTWVRGLIGRQENHKHENHREKDAHPGIESLTKETRRIIRAGGDVADGLRKHEAEAGIKQNTEASVRADLAAVVRRRDLNDRYDPSYKDASGKPGIIWWLADGVAVSMASLWRLLILICFSATMGSAVQSARFERVGVGGYALAIAVGLAVGTCCSWAMWIMHKMVVTNLQRRPDQGHSLSEWYFGAFYFSKILCIALSVFLGGWLSSVLLRLVF